MAEPFWLHNSKQHLRAILVCVDYLDLLQVTLMMNHHHFKEICVVTRHDDREALEYLAANYPEVFVVQTDLFYEDGAIFNKWRALEYALSEFGREGWLCLMDADIVWPERLPAFLCEPGKLYSPLRHMYEDVKLPLPEENDWRQFRIHPNTNEWAGYSQIFHSSDPVLGDPPWHEIDWSHAGGADSFFQMKWDRVNKIRPPFNVLHLGYAGRNWCGRTDRLLDGGFPQEADDRLGRLRELIKERRRKSRAKIADPYSHEKLKN